MPEASLSVLACLRARDDFGQVVVRGNVDGGCKGRLNHAAEHKRQDSASPCFELGYVHGVPLIRAVCVGMVMPACKGCILFYSGTVCCVKRFCYKRSLKNEGSGFR